MTRSRFGPVLLVVALVTTLAAGYLIGSVGPASASSLTPKAVKRIAGQVVKKKAKKLSVAHAATAMNAGALGGLPPAAYQEKAQRWTISATGLPMSYNRDIPVPAGTWLVSYTVGMGSIGAGQSFCYLALEGTGSELFFADDQSTDVAGQTAHSGSGVVTVGAGDTVRLHCGAPTTWTAEPSEPIQVSAVPLDAAATTVLAPEN